ncbi:Integrase zinc binding domain [Popillia japonica]|uniref:RNA-directed DNA polymerase n=1 Tax=Popillia japonica TaxID=7064 RepID=A0AAW1IFI6_POPJA
MTARDEVWWPGLDGDLENMVKSCPECQTFGQRNKGVSIIPWSKSPRNWFRIHIDFFTFDGTEFLLVVDSTSKWLDVYVMKNGTSANLTIEKLRHSFAIMGLPKYIVSDNGPPFGSITFQQFCMSNGIILQHSPPYHPQSNGLAEKTVDTIKRSLKKQLQSKKESLQHSIDNFLFAYRNTPSTSTNRSPSELIFKQLPRTKLSLLRPREAERKDNNEGKGKRSRKYFTVNEKVYAYMTLEKIWIPGKIVKVLTSNTYLVLVRGNVRHMHVDHLKKDNTLPVNLPITNLPYSSPQCLAEETEKSNLPVVSNDIPTATFTENKDLPTDISVPPSPCEFPTTTPELRRSQRTIRPPERLDL